MSLSIDVWMFPALMFFIFMGAMLERAGIAARLFDAIHLSTRRLPGGPAVGTVLIASSSPPPAGSSVRPNWWSACWRSRPCSNTATTRG